MSEIESKTSDDKPSKTSPEISLTRRLERLNDITEPRRSLVLRQLTHIPDKRKTLYLDACLFSASPRQAIKAYCQNCVGYEDIAIRIGDCSAFACPLWSYRPYQNKEILQ